MKRLLAVLVVILALLIPSFSFAVGVASVSNVQRINVLGQPQRIVLTITWVDDNAGTTLAINPVTYGIQGWYLLQAETDPGATAPTTLYDITLVSTSGVDLALGLLMNRSATATERVSISTGAVAYPVIIESFTFTLTNNSVVGGQGTLKLIFCPN